MSWERSISVETESSESFSWHSERLSDEQTSSLDNTQSPEVTYNATFGVEKENDCLQTLSKKLTQALLNGRAKEDSVRQHEKVAEEAIIGWERAENEMLILKRRNDVLTKKNSVLEERVGHLDGALKECLKQLRQEREFQEDKINHAVAKRSSEWEMTRCDLENRLAELNSHLRNAKVDAINSALLDVCSKLEAAERENSILKLNTLYKDEELQLRTYERDLSTRAAESASKNYLDSIKKVAKLEAECHRLKAASRKEMVVRDHGSVIASSDCLKSLLSSRSDVWEDIPSFEIDSSIIGTLANRLTIPSVEIALMDDFLDMERMATQSEMQSRSKPGWQAELKVGVEKIDSEKINLVMDLTECQNQLQKSEDQLKQTQEELVALSNQLAVANEETRAAQREVAFTGENLSHSIKLLDEAKDELLHMQTQLMNSNEEKSVLMVELENALVKKAGAESQIKDMELELRTAQSSVCALKEEIDQERKLSRDAFSKSKKLETEICKMKLQSKFQKLEVVEEFRINQDKDLAVVARKYSECRLTLASLDQQLKYLATLDGFLISSETAVGTLV